jgi:non-specific serine/threonine protein kinase
MLGRNAEALALVERVDPVAYQASTSDPGRAAVLMALRAQILMRLGRRAEALARMRQAVQDMQDAGVSVAEIAPYRKALLDNAVTAR